MTDNENTDNENTDKDSLVNVNENMLHAYVDGLLSPRDLARVEAWLVEHPTRAEEVAEWQRQNAAIMALYSTREAEAHVAGLDISGVSAPLQQGWFQPMQMAAMLAMVLAGIAGGWFARGTLETQTITVTAELVQQAISAHRVYASEVLHPVEVAASDKAHLVGWLSKRLGVDLAAPDLSANGFDLVGGRLLPGTDGPAAQFMYENATGTRITVYATAGSPETMASFQFEERGGVAGIYWQDTALSYAVIGDIGRDDLTALATEVYRQLI